MFFKRTFIRNLCCLVLVKRIATLWVTVSRSPICCLVGNFTDIKTGVPFVTENPHQRPCTSLKRDFVLFMKALMKVSFSLNKSVEVKYGASLYRGIFVQLMTMQEKQILARGIENHKEQWVWLHIFLEIIKQK